MYGAVQRGGDRTIGWDGAMGRRGQGVIRGGASRPIREARAVPVAAEKYGENTENTEKKYGWAVPDSTPRYRLARRVAKTSEEGGRAGVPRVSQEASYVDVSVACSNIDRAADPGDWTLLLSGQRTPGFLGDNQSSQWTPLTPPMGQELLSDSSRPGCPGYVLSGQKVGTRRGSFAHSSPRERPPGYLGVTSSPGDASNPARASFPKSKRKNSFFKRRGGGLGAVIGGQLVFGPAGFGGWTPGFCGVGDIVPRA